MKKLFEKLDKLEKKLEVKERSAKKTLVFIAEKQNNGSFNCTASRKGGNSSTFTLKDQTALNDYLAQNEAGVVLIDDLLCLDEAN